MSRAFGIVNFAGNNIQGNPMQAYRPTGAISFLGRYRVIDFPISNMSNSGIDSIQVYIRRKPRSLVEHLGTGRHYNINSKRGNLNLLFCENGDENSIYSTDLAAYVENLDAIEEMSEEYVVIVPSYMVYTADYEEFLQNHIESGADITDVSECGQCKRSVPELPGAESEQTKRCAVSGTKPRKCKKQKYFHGHLCNEKRDLPGSDR